MQSNKETNRRREELDLTEARQYAVQLALGAGGILRDFLVQGVAHEQKEGLDFTTVADKKVEEFLRDNLISRFPQTRFLGEETAEDDYLKLKDAENLWIVDPLDGTINFSRGHQNFAISIGLVSFGLPRLGVIHIPMRDEIYWAQENLPGAWLNSQPIEVSETDSFAKVLVALDWPYANMKHREEVLRWAHCFAPHVLQIKSSGSAVSDLAQVAAGKIDAYVQLGTKPWDTAAGSLLVQKAGGVVTTPAGEEWNVFNHRIMATNRVLHEQILSLIR